MSELGLAATELGPDDLATTLAEHDLRAVGGFTPFVLHRPDVDPLVELGRLLPGFTAARRTGQDVQRVLEGSSISLCLDTGHLLIGADYLRNLLSR